MTQAISKTQSEMKRMLSQDSVRDKLESCLGKRANQFATSILSLTARDEYLAKCKPDTILGAAMTAATLDLPIQKDLGFAWIIPYGNEAQFQMGYKGFIQLALRTGQYKRMNAEVVNDSMFGGFDAFGEPVIYWENFDPTKETVGYFFGYEMVNGFRKTAYWTKERVKDHAKRYSQGYRSKNKSPWDTDFDMMALKTVVKNTLSKWGILSVELQQALVSDQAVQASDDRAYVDNGEVTAETEQEAKAAITGSFSGEAQQPSDQLNMGEQNNAQKQ